MQDRRDDRLTAWFERWRVPIQRWIASHGSMSTADLDDLVQEVFLRLLRYSDDSSIEYPQTYLFRIASNVASEWRERAQRHPMQDASGFEGLQMESHEEPENIVANALISKRVQQAVTRLPQRQREVLMLHIHENLTRPQIAARLGLSCRMVRRDLAHAYTQLRWDLDAELQQDAADNKIAAP
ncbi:MAG: sigma-70 family RNA polymerase sigma factor [Steroidobacteraceae bacterium]